MPVLLKNGRHIEFLVAHVFKKKSKEYLCEIMSLYHNLKDASTFGQLSAALLLILFRTMTLYLVSVHFPYTKAQ